MRRLRMIRERKHDLQPEMLEGRELIFHESLVLSALVTCI